MNAGREKVRKKLDQQLQATALTKKAHWLLEKDDEEMNDVAKISEYFIITIFSPFLISIGLVLTVRLFLSTPTK